MTSAPTRLLVRTLLPTAALLALCPAAFAQSIEPNLIFEVTTNDRWRSMSESPEPTVTPETWLAAFTRKLDVAALAPLAGKDTAFVAEIAENGQILATHRFPRKVDTANTYFRFNLIPDPASTEDAKLRWDWSGQLALALSKLPKGKHPLEVRGYFELDGNRTPAVLGRLTFDNSTGSGDLAKYAAQIDKNAKFDIVKHNQKYFVGHPDDIKTILYNNSPIGTIVRFHNKRGNQTIAIPGYGKKEITIGFMESVWIRQADGGFKSGPAIGAGEKGKQVKIHR